MIYQVRTFATLCFSKKYLKTKEEIKAHIREVVRRSNEFRKNPGKHENDIAMWRPKVSPEEMQGGIEILSIDEGRLPEWSSLLGSEVEIHDPYFNPK